MDKLVQSIERSSKKLELLEKAIETHKRLLNMDMSRYSIVDLKESRRRLADLTGFNYYTVKAIYG